MKLLADINVSRHVVAALCAEGHDAVHASALVDCRAADKQILEEARRRDAVVITHDQDFTAILATTGVTKPSLINIRAANVDNQWLTRTILTVIASSHEELSTGAIVTVDDRQIRIRPLPVF